MAGCSPKRAATITDAPAPSAESRPIAEIARVRAAEPIVHALAGRSVVIPIVPDDADFPAASWRPEREPEITFITGERVESEVYWISGAPSDTPNTWEWLPPTVEWSALTLAEVIAQHETGSHPGFWALVAQLPKRATGRELRLDGRPLSVKWLADPPAKTDAGRAPQPRASAEALRALGELLQEEERDPLRRWRIRLMLDRWSAARLWSDQPPRRELDSPALEALAAQNEWRWRAALAALAQSGPDTAADVLARLTAVVLTPDGALLPAWPLDDAAAARLRATLLRTESDDDDRLNEAQAWLASMPPALAWVIDDGPVVASAADAKPGASARRVRTAVSELTGGRARVSVTPEGAPPGDSRMVEEHETLVVTTEAPVGSRAVEPLRVQVGRWTGRVAFRATALGVTPPGLALGPLLPQWRMAGWLAGTPGAADEDWTTAGLLHKSESGDGWQVYVECRFAENASIRGEAVRLYWGAPGSAERVIEIPAPAAGESGENRWIASVPLPAKAIEANGTVRLTLMRIDARGARSSWPRPMMPDETEPARAIIDLTTWKDLADE